MDKTCATCIENDDGLCDRKGTLVHDDDSCDQHKESWKDAMLRQFFRKNNEIRDHFTRNEGVIEINRKEPASGRGKGIPGFLKRWKKNYPRKSGNKRRKSRELYLQHVKGCLMR